MAAVGVRIPPSAGMNRRLSIRERRAARDRASAFERDRRERLKRLKVMTQAEAIREMEALQSLSVPGRRLPRPKVPARRFVTVYRG